MQLRPNPRIQREQRGFTMVELLAAIVMFNLLVAGLVKLFVGQNSMVESLEGWAEGDPVLYVSQGSDPMARALGVPATWVSKRTKPNHLDHDGKSKYSVDVLKVQRQVSDESATVLFLQTEVDKDGSKDGSKGKGKNKDDDKDKKSKPSKREDRE